MTRDQLTAILAECVMGWRVGPDRFLLGNRHWIPRWRFQPFKSLEDAFRLLDKVVGTYTLTTQENTFTAEVRIGTQTGVASGEPKAASITLAVARAIGQNVPAKEDVSLRD